MLNKNIYILSTVGHYSEYIDWILNISESSKSASTVPNPVNLACDVSVLPNTITEQQLHIINPPMMVLNYMMAWLLVNKPLQKSTYTLASYDKLLHFSTGSVFTICQFDPDAFYINIHINNDMDVAKFVALNTFYNWPHFLDAMKNYPEIPWGHLDFDHNLDDTQINLDIRNKFVIDWENAFQFNSSALNKAKIQLQNEKRQNWFNTRKSHNNYEMKTDEWHFVDSIALNNNIIDIGVKDIFEDNFVDNLESAVAGKNIGDFDFSYAKNFHSNFINSQQHLQWFTDIETFRQSKTLSPYLLSTNFLQALVVSELLENLSPSIDWQSYSTEDLAKIVTG